MKFGNMSRIGLRKINIPEGITVDIKDRSSMYGGQLINVKGPKGTMDLHMRLGVKVSVEGNEINLVRKNDTPKIKSLHGLYNSLITNMINGVQEGYSKKVEVKGIGYKIVSKSPRDLDISIGFSHIVKFNCSEDILLQVEDNGTSVVVSGFDKQKVGEVAARIRSIRPVEPYKGKGFKYENEEVKRKQGKSAGAK